MKLWMPWWSLVERLRTACARQRTFLWMGVVLIGFTIRPDLLGVTSIVRAIGLTEACYDRLLDFFHSPALVIDRLCRLWTDVVLSSFPLVRINGRVVLVGDGLKVAKSGKRMPAVKKLHQESEANTKRPYIFGHSCQAIAILAGSAASTFAVPLICRIHEGVKFTNRDKRSLVDKMVLMLLSLSGCAPYYFVADAYYAARQTIRGTLKRGNHLISRVRMNAVAYHRARQPRCAPRGRRRMYGTKVRLRTLFNNEALMREAPSPVYGETNVTLRYRCADLLWRSAGQVVRFVAVHHPTKGRVLLISTDILLSPLEIIKLYGLRFKIEVSFKQALRTVGAFGYHFWFADMQRIGRKGKTQHLHKCCEAYREKLRRKMDAYHRFMQLGLIAQGLMQYLACCHTKTVWQSFGSWIRTIRPEILPSEMVTSIALKNTVFDFLAGSPENKNLTKFIRSRIDVTRTEGARLVA